MQKTVVIGVTGCVAIYKTCELIRCLQKAGLRVKIVMTQHATNFINPTLFRSLTREPVAVGLFDDAPGDPIHHISLAKEADVFLIAPCTANVLAKITHGIADDLLTTTALATKAPLVLAPAMNVTMYEAQPTQDNLRILAERGVHIIEAESGYLACGDKGKGRLAEPDTIASYLIELLKLKLDFLSCKVLITAGPTHEPLDSVRFISNPSSGKTGYALARAAAERGAQVTLISGPTSLTQPSGVSVVEVRTACEMYEEVDARFDSSNLAIFSAAVSDYRPEQAAPYKLKKGRDEAALTTLRLVENPDILAAMAARKTKSQYVVGFAAETSHLLENSREKLHTKQADLIVGNLVSESRAFGTDTNEVILVSHTEEVELPLMSKNELAHTLLDYCAAHFRQKSE